MSNGDNDESATSILTNFLYSNNGKKVVLSHKVSKITFNPRML